MAMHQLVRNAPKRIPQEGSVEDCTDLFFELRMVRIDVSLVTSTRSPPANHLACLGPKVCFLYQSLLIHNQVTHNSDDAFLPSA